MSNQPKLLNHYCASPILPQLTLAYKLTLPQPDLFLRDSLQNTPQPLPQTLNFLPAATLLFPNPLMNWHLSDHFAAPAYDFDNPTPNRGSTFCLYNLPKPLTITCKHLAYSTHPPSPLTPKISRLAYLRMQPTPAITNHAPSSRLDFDC